MSGSINKVILVGRAGADAETRSFTNGGKVASFSMATSDVWTDKDSGERKEKVQWHRVSVLNEAKAEICGKYVKKGTLVSVVGRLENRDYEKNGTKVAVTEVVLRPYEGEVALLDSPQQAGDERAGEGGRTEPTMTFSDFAACLIFPVLVFAQDVLLWKQADQLAALSAKSQAEAAVTTDTYLRALDKLPSLKGDDPVMAAAGRAVALVVGKGR